MKRLLPGLLVTLGAFALFSASSASANVEPRMTSTGISKGTTLRSLNLIKGTGAGFTGVSSDTPVTVLRVEGVWLLVDFPAQVGGPTWLNSNSIISYQERL